MNEIDSTNNPTPKEVTFEVLAPEAPAAPGPRLRHALTLANLWHVWIGLKSTAAPSSVLVYQNIARQFCGFFGPSANGSIPHKLTPQGMTEWMQNLQRHRKKPSGKPLSAVRINKVNAIAKAFLRWMKLMKYVNEDLAACIPHLMEPGLKESVIFTEEEYEKLKAFCAGRPYCQPHLWLIILGYRTGMSLVDCCHLRWKDVHLHDNEPSYIEIRRIKMQRLGDKARCQIPIVPFSDIHLWLLNLRNVKPWKRADGITDYVHQETQGLYVTTMGNLRGDFRVIFIRAGIDRNKTFKCFRNSMCSNLVNSGMNLASVCQITGHNNVQTLLRYLKADRRALQDGLAKAQQYSALKDVKVNSAAQDEEEAFL